MSIQLFRASFFFLLIITGQSFAADGPFEVLPRRAPIPKDNPLTLAKVELGKQLFFDPRISKDGTVSCNSCHNVMSSGEDNRPNSVGVGGKHGGRSSPTVWNSAFMQVLFWDGRAASLEEQAKGPMINPVEMAMDSHDAVVARIKSIPGYVAEFEKVFKGPNAVNIDNIVKAIATYERTLVTPNSAFDRYLKGNKKAISAEAKRGMELFQEHGCVACHNGPTLAGPVGTPGEGRYLKFPFTSGSSFEKKYRLTDDPGRFQVTKEESDKNTWRVPTLRNVALTAPYFHNGSVPTLEEAVRVMVNTQLSKDLPDADIKALVAFLESLTGELPKQIMPILPPTPGITLVEEPKAD